MKKILIFSFLLIFSQVLIAQKGDFFLNHFQPNLPNIDHQNYQITQDEKGRLCLANRKGVLKFDGEEWELVATPASALALGFDPQDHKLYVGCRNGFGFISADERGIDIYTSLSGKLDFFGDISHIEIKGSWVYFLSENVLYEYSTVQKKITQEIKANSEMHFFSLFSHGRSVYVFTEEQELWELTGNGLKLLGISMPGENNPLFTQKVNVTQSIIGTAEGNLFMWENDVFTPITLKDQKYLTQHNLLGGLLLNDSSLVLSTLSGGVVTVNWKNGKSLGKVNYNTGLPDNEIYDIYKDQNNNIWISHEYGITSLDFHLPIRVYSNFLGLNGKVLSVIERNGQLYVGTSTGLFYLDKATTTVELQKLIKEREKSRTNTRVLGRKPLLQNSNKNNETVVIDADESEKESKKKSGWLKKLFSKKKKKKSEDDEGEDDDFAEAIIIEKPSDTLVVSVEVPDGELIIEEIKPKTRIEQVVIENELDFYIFKPIEVVEGKCLQLITVKGKLLAITTSGVYEVSATKANKISYKSARNAYWSEKYQRLYISTYSNEVLVYKLEKKEWKKLDLFPNFREFVNGFVEDSNGNFWIVGNNYIYKVSLDANGGPSGSKPYKLFNAFNDAVVAVSMNDKPYFILSNTAYFYDYKADALVKDSLFMPTSGNAKLLQNQQQHVWLGIKRNWKMISEQTKMDISKFPMLNYLSWLGELSGVFLSSDNNKIWAVNQNNELFQLQLQTAIQPKSGYQVFLKNIRNHKNEFFRLGNFEIERGENELHFTFTTPTYFQNNGVEYQYKLIGRDKKWSAWTSNNNASFLSLPAGKYKLAVRGKNVAGEISEITPIAFEVVPPYWEQPWFYGAEALFFASLLVFSYRLNSSKKANKIISKGLTIFTLILIVEFIQVTLEAKVNIKSTPFTNFLVQAGIALCVFPLERLMASLIRREALRKKLHKDEVPKNTPSK